MKVGIIMGSDSDLEVMKGACHILEELDIPFEVDIVSAHRTPNKMYEYANNAHKRGIEIIIAGAGGAAHLPGMVASLTSLPVIGVPVKSRSMSGMDSLYSIVQMPPGVPVATVAINGAQNAGLLAAKILASSRPDLFERLEKYRENLRDKVINKSDELSKQGYQNYQYKGK